MVPTEEDIKYLQLRILDTESEKHHDNIKSGSISNIETTNKVQQDIDNNKLYTLLQLNDIFFL